MSDVVAKPPPKRACDACRVRKVRCSGERPCAGCLNINVDCTFVTTQSAKRGPRNLRAKTIQQIQQASRRAGEDVQTYDSDEGTGGSVIGIDGGNELGVEVSPLEIPLPPMIATPPVENPPLYRLEVNCRLEGLG